MFIIYCMVNYTSFDCIISRHGLAQRDIYNTISASSTSSSLVNTCRFLAGIWVRFGHPVTMATVRSGVTLVPSRLSSCRNGRVKFLTPEIYTDIVCNFVLKLGNNCCVFEGLLQFISGVYVTNRVSHATHKHSQYLTA